MLKNVQMYIVKIFVNLLGIYLQSNLDIIKHDEIPWVDSLMNDFDLVYENILLTENELKMFIIADAIVSRFPGNTTTCLPLLTANSKYLRSGFPTRKMLEPKRMATSRIHWYDKIC